MNGQDKNNENESQNQTALLMEIRDRLTAHATWEEDYRAELMSAYPDGDANAHRRYHEALIAREQERSALRRAIIEKSLASLVWALIVGIGIAVLDYIRNGGARLPH